MAQKPGRFDWRLVLGLVLVSLLPLWQWWDPRIPRTHDILLQIQRIATFAQGIQQGDWFPRWGGNLNWGYGHPSPMFLYPLASYLGAFFSLTGLGYVTATKLVLGAAAVVQAVGMWLFQARVFGKRAALVGTLIYVLAPYRLVDINVRASMGELVGLAVLPLVFWRFYELVNGVSRKNVAAAAGTVFFLIMAHNAVGLMGLVMLGIWLVFLILTGGLKGLKAFRGAVLALALGLGLAAFYWMPGVIEGRYTFQKEFTSFEVFSSRYPRVRELLNSPWGYGPTPEKGRPAGFKVAVGWVQWLAGGAGLILLAGRRLKLSRLKQATTTAFLVIFWGGVFLLTPWSAPAVKLVEVIHRFQFPWRFLALTTVAGSVLTGALVSGLKRKLTSSLTGIILVLALLEAWPGFFIQGYIDPQEVDPQNSSFTGPVTWTTDTGESTPRWAVRFQDKFPEADVQVVSGRAQVRVIEKRFTEHRLEVTAFEPSQIVDNTLYFPGWVVYVNGQRVPIEFQDQNWRGLITFPVLLGKSEVLVRFEDTRVRALGELVSEVSFGILVVVVAGPFLSRRKMGARAKGEQAEFGKKRR